MFNLKFDTHYIYFTGSPKPNIEWIKEEKQLSPEPSRYRHIEDADLHTLIIQDVSHDDAGKYKCRAWKKYGTADASTSINVIMMGNLLGGKPPFFISRPTTFMTVNCDSDRSVSFRLSGDPKPKGKKYNF